MKVQSFAFILSAVGLVHGLAIDPLGGKDKQLLQRNNWGTAVNSYAPSSSYPSEPHPTVGSGKTPKGDDHHDKDKDCDEKNNDGKHKDGKDGKDDKDGKDGKDGKGKDSKYPTVVDPAIDLPPVGVPINKPLPQFDTVPTVPPNQDGDVEAITVEEDDPRVLLVGRYVERLARQMAPKRITFTGDVGPIYNEQDAVDILPDDYCIPEDSREYYQDFNCTNYRGGYDPQSNDRNRKLGRSLEAGTYARANPQIYRWRRGSVISISVQRNNKLVLMNLNAGIAGATPAFVAVRAHEITAAAMSRAYRLWNTANIGVRFAWTTDLGRSTYFTRTGGVKGTALATADFPAQPNGYQHLVTAWDVMLELEWHPVGPNILSHELGHALGLDHNDAPNNVYELWAGTGDSIMGSEVDSGVNAITAIPARDREGTRILYNELNPPTTNERTVAILRAPQGPNPIPPVFRPKCRWSAFGYCVYY